MPEIEKIVFEDRASAIAQAGRFGDMSFPLAALDAVLEKLWAPMLAAILADRKNPFVPAWRDGVSPSGAQEA